MGKPKSDPNHMGELTSSPNSQQGREISVNPHSSIWQGATTENSSSQAVTHGGGRRDRFFQRLTDSELQQKRAKGLCFHCDEKFAPGHNCANKHLQVLFLSEDDSNPKQEISNMEQANPNSFSSLNLSYNSLLGFTSSHTMKVRGQLGSREVVILIDSGASHSFVASKLVR